MFRKLLNSTWLFCAAQRHYKKHMFVVSSSTRLIWPY